MGDMGMFGSGGRLEHCFRLVGNLGVRDNDLLIIDFLGKIIVLKGAPQGNIQTNLISSHLIMFNAPVPCSSEANARWDQISF